MKQADIKRLEQALKAYEKVVELLDKTDDNLFVSEREQIGNTTTYLIVNEFLRTASYEKKCLESKIRAFKSL